MAKTGDVARAMSNATRIVEYALPIAFGPPGVNGDPEAILYAVSRLAAIYQASVEWKLDFRRVR